MNKDKIKAFETFREFYRDEHQKGSTLASSAPVKFSATKSLKTRRAFMLREAFLPKNKVLANSLLVPPEIAWAAGFVPLNLEMYSSLLASHSKIGEFTSEGSLTAPRCSFINSLNGAFLNGIVPTPDVLVSSTAYCEAISLSFEDLEEGYEVPHYHIEIPQYPTVESIRSLAGELKELFWKLADLGGLSKEEASDQFRKVMLNSALARKEFIEIWTLRKVHAPLNLGLEPLHWHFQFLPMWGDDRMPEICKRLKEEVIEYIESGESKDGTPVGMFGLIPYGRTEIWKKLMSEGAFSSFEGVNFMGDYILPDIENFVKLTEDDLFENIAINLIGVPMRGGETKRKADEFNREAKTMGSDGMIIFSHEHCQLLAPRLHMIEEAATNNDMKVVSIGGDCILGMPQGPTGIRLGTFISNLKEADQISKLPELKVKPRVLDKSKVMRLGVDFGSGFSKYVLLNEENNVVYKGVFSSGIDYPALLEEIKGKVQVDKDYFTAVSGVGGDNPRFSEMVNVQTTEINALINTSRNLFPASENLLVIDIGTQDVKVLKFNGMGTSPWINTNKSCGAGTGLVLVQILERWKQTNPEISFDQLDDMAYGAKTSELINTTCGIFAVTNVVSALVQSDEEK